MKDERGRRLGLLNVEQRLKVINGSSIETVPKFARENPDVKCDVLSVDGGHYNDIPLRDIQNMRLLANKSFHVLFVDDTNCDGTGCVDGRVGYIGRLFNGVKVLSRVSESAVAERQRFERGVSVLQYTTSYLEET